MTADVELLPCPFCGGRAKTKLPYVRCVDCGGQMCFGEGAAFDAAITAWNARACVAHATAAKDAEIEALRAERDLFRAETIALAKDAERLAEALRDAAVALDIAGRPGNAKRFRAALEQETALHPTAAQEGKE